MKSIKVSRPKNLKAALALANEKARKHDIFFVGDEKSGSGSGKGFSAKYIIHPDCIEVLVLDRPFWASSSMVKRKIQKFWKGYLRQEGTA